MNAPTMRCRQVPLIALAALLMGSVGSGGGIAEASRAVPDARKDRDRARHRGHSRSMPAIEMQHLTTHESFVLRPDDGGRLGGKRLRGLRHFLRCHHTGKEHAMAPRLAELLYATAHHFGDRNITVVAGYRAPKVARQKGNIRSPHKKGVACDFRIDGIKVTEVRDYVRRAFNGVGIGYYPNSGFIHLDVGRKGNAFWIDYSGPGERASYSSDADGDLRSGAADRAREESSGDEGAEGSDPSSNAAVPGAEGAREAAKVAEDPGVAPSSPERTPIE